MATRDLAALLAGFDERLPGSDAERRAVRTLADELSASGQDVRIEPFWCRPNWALAHCWHLALGLAGSLVAVGSGHVGGAMVLVALVSVIFDAQLGVSLGRRLTHERASQNVIATRRARARPGTSEGQTPSPASKPVRLVITANYDVGRVGLVYAPRPRAAAAWFARRTGGRVPGWLAWIGIALVWLLVTAVLRAEGDKGTVIGAIQLPPTVIVVIAFAALLELGTGGGSPGAGDNGSGTAVAIALAKALAVAPPGQADVELVLQGAGDAAAIGLRRYLRARRRELSGSNAVIVGVAACGRGRPAWWLSDGSFLPLRTARPLRDLSARVAADEGYLAARPHRGRGVSPIYPALQRRLPAITIGCLDERGLVPDSHRHGDTADRLSTESIDVATQFGLLLADAVDGHLARAQRPAAATTTPA
jgi:hypothetical protein